MNPLSKRRAGILLHPTSLPSGKLDQDARTWIDWLASAGFTVWQILPLGVPQENRSPYMCLSSFAINPELMEAAEIDLAVESARATDVLCWYRTQQHWIDDYALFTVLKQLHGGQPWYDWPAQYRDRERTSLDILQLEHCQAINSVLLQQYVLHSRWQSIRNYAHHKGISIFGDLPLFVAHDSTDVWANQDYFLLDEQGQTTFVAGVPPDYFCQAGQRWGNPQYDWNRLQNRQFDYWVKRLDYHLQNFDLLRIDHFRGMQAVWMIEGAAEDAAHGYWQSVPGEALLAQVQSKLGELNLVAEDLGTITTEVEALRKRFQLPGMAVLQFAWDGSTDNPHLPANITADRVVYTGTHDNDTTAGWFSSLSKEVQNQIRAHIGVDHREQICSAFIDAALNSAARLAIIPMQDILCLGSHARMNTPGTDMGNWSWQYTADALTRLLAEDLRNRLEQANRFPGE